MSDLRKAAEAVLEAWDWDWSEPRNEALRKRMEALRQALAQPEQKPVAWGLPNLQDPIRRKQALLRVDLKIPDGAQFPQFWVPLYTAPPSIEAAVLAEREACAKVCDLVAKEIDDTNGIATYCAAAIRARGEK